MPIMPTVSTLNANSVGILNAIRDNASADYYNAVPAAQATTESIQAVGQAILAYQPRMNEFVSSLVNRIGKVMITSKLYQNPLSFMKQGILDMGESIEEIFVNIAKVKGYDWNTTTDEAKLLLQRTNPDIRTAFHALNLQVYYPVTITESELHLAFLSMNGVTDLILRIVNSLYSAANYDEYIMMKYDIAVNAWAGNIAARTIKAVTDSASGSEAVKAIKAISRKFGFMSTEYNVAGVNNYEADPANIYVIMTADFESNVDVDVLASAFNISKVEFMGRRVVVDNFSFNAGEIDRLKDILANDPTAPNILEDITEINTALNTVGCIVMGREYMQVYDVLERFTEQYNAALLCWNDFFHKWSIFSASPFTNVCMFTTTTPSVTSVKVVAPSTGHPEDVIHPTVTVNATAFANKGVVWSIAPTTNVSIDPATGVTKFGASATGEYTLTATSVFDSKKKGTAAITIS